MYFYNVFGLEIQSDLDMDGLPAGNGGCDIRFRIQTNRNLDQLLPGETAWQKIDRERTVLNIRNFCRFTINAGREVVIFPAKQARDSLMRQYLIGPVLAILLYQRGRLVLHASSVVINGTPVAILAETGWGKSSLAGIFHQRGHTVLSDDLTPVELSAGGPQIFPGTAQLKLNSDVAKAIGLDWDRLTVIDQQESKRGLPVNPILTGQPFLLKKVFVLTDDGKTRILPIQPQEMIIELIRHSYPTRLGQPGDAKHLQLCGLLARNIKILRLMRSPDLSSLPELAQCIEADLAVE